MEFFLPFENDNNGNLENWSFPIIKNDNKIIEGKRMLKLKKWELIYIRFKLGNCNCIKIIEHIAIAAIGVGNPI